MSWIFLDKPSGIRSMQALAIVKKACKIKKAGTLGILDEFASGLLPIATGETTKEIFQYNLDGKKEYMFNIQWGISTNTGDYKGVQLQNEIVDMEDMNTVEKDKNNVGNILPYPLEHDVINMIQNFIGPLKQRPSAFSNIKINGVRAHQLARSGLNPIMPVRDIFIESISLLQHNNNESLLLAVVSSGTYIRTLAEDMGKALGFSCSLNYLRRTSIIVGKKVIYPTVALQYYLDIIEKIK